MSTNHSFWRERRAETESNRGPSVYQLNALPLGHTDSSHAKQCPQTATFEERGEPKRNRTEVLLLTKKTKQNKNKTNNNNNNNNNKIWNKITASVLKQDPNTERFKRTLIYLTKQATKTQPIQDIFLSHFSSFLTVYLLFKCRFVAWQRGCPRKCAYRASMSK